MFLISYIDSLLNKITMYRFTLYYLIAIIVYAVIAAFLGYLPYKPLDIILSTTIAVSAGYVSNLIFSKILKAVTNIESVFITSLILVLIIPIRFPLDATFVALASALSMALKYLLTVEKRHIFNPAAVSVVALSLISSHVASWWVGTAVMVPVILIGGLLLIRKTRRESLVFTFLISYLLIIAVAVFFRTTSVSFVISSWQISMLNSALLFFAFVMLTEPLTSPTTKKLQMAFAFLVALFYSIPQVRLINIGITPEMALSIGNIFTYFINPNYRMVLSLKNKIKLSKDTYGFSFEKRNDFKFIPGQYMEWTLSHKNTDSRGNRRYFSISTSPKEEDLGITVKFYDNSSSFKNKLLNLPQGGEIIASQVAGDFTLPKNLKKPLVFLAGGVGIAPFRSIIQYVIDNNLSIDIVLIYSNRTEDEILFSDIFDKAEKNGVKSIYLLTDENNIPKGWQGEKGHITQDMVKKLVPDFGKRTFYISGPQLMVQSLENMLKGMGISKSKIKTDFFPGYIET